MASFLRLALALSLLVAAVLADHAEWENFKKKHSKKFHNADHEHARHKAFNKSLEFVARHNAEHAKGKHTFTVGINELSDLTDDERNALNGFVHPGDETKIETRTMTTDRANLPASVNWTAQLGNGYVTSVKYQGGCGSCWAFSAVGAIEGLLFKTTGTLESLSPQNLADCVYPRNGCSGGAMSTAFNYVKTNNGIASDAKYPYVSGSTKQTNACAYGSGPAAATVKSYVNVNKTEAALQEASATVGPISIAVNASGVGFSAYKDGIYHADCAPSVNHGVLLVGYGTENGQDYWLVKNSWGVSWGIKGYIKIARNANNMCGITNGALYPTN